MMKEKVIFLVDMQSFYASVEKAENPHLKNKPVIVSGDPEKRGGVVLVRLPAGETKRCGECFTAVGGAGKVS